MPQSGTEPMALTVLKVETQSPVGMSMAGGFACW